MLLLVGKLRVDLIGHDIDVMFQDDLRDGLQILPLHDGPGGVVGEGQHQDLGPVGDVLLQLRGGEPELVLLLQVDDHGLCSGHHGAGLVGHEAGLRDQHLVPGIDHGPEADVDGFGSAHGDQDLLHGMLIADSLLSVQIFRNLLPQLLQACVGGIEGLPLLQGVDALVPDVPGSVEVGLAYPQGNGILHLLGDVEEFPDARRLDFYDSVC